MQNSSVLKPGNLVMYYITYHITTQSPISSSLPVVVMPLYGERPSKHLAL